LQNNLADCALRSGDLKTARTHAETALQLYDQMGMRTERTRVEWILARVQLRERRYDLAATNLRDVSDKFERLGLAAEAGGALLDLVEIHVIRKEWEAARKLAERLAGLFTTSAVPVHAARACAYLREAVQAQRANTELVAYVRDYVTQRDVEMAFAPPA
jgi:lipopolysaccharide biosynthesis regulator YciM